MALRCEQHLNILRGGIEDGRKIVRCHIGEFNTAVSEAPICWTGVDAECSRIGKMFVGGANVILRRRLS